MREERYSYVEANEVNKKSGRLRDWWRHVAYDVRWHRATLCMMVVHPSSNHQSRTQQCSQFRFVLFNVNRQSQGESYQNFNAYKFTNKTHTDECYADISHYLQKNVSASLNSTTQNCVEALFGMWLLFASPVFRQCPKSPPTEHVNLSPSK